MNFTAETKIKDVIAANPKTADVLLGMGMHCLGCVSSINETVAGAARMHGLTIETVLQALNAAEQGEMSEATAASAQPKGGILQADRSTFAVVPHIPAGICTPELLRKIADAAEKYQAAALKITSAQRIAIVGLKQEDVPKVWSDLGMEAGEAGGNLVRSVKVCPGTTFCKRGVQDSVSLGLELDKRYIGLKLPSKFKIAVAGCPNKCTDAASVDLGFMGTAKGFHVYVGGNGGVKPRPAELLAEGKTMAECLEIADKVISFYKVMGRSEERIGGLVSRMGIAEFSKAVLA